MPYNFFSQEKNYMPGSVIKDKKDLPVGWPRAPGLPLPASDMWPEGVPRWIPQERKDRREEQRPEIRLPADVPPLKL